MAQVSAIYRIFKIPHPAIHHTGRRRTTFHITEPLPNLGAHTSSVESMVANELNRRQIIWEPQMPLGGGREVKGGQVVDFYLPLWNLVIRVQGDYWHSLGITNTRDDAQALWLRGHHFQVADIWEHDIRSDVRAALDKVLGKA